MSSCSGVICSLSSSISSSLLPSPILSFLFLIYARLPPSHFPCLLLLILSGLISSLCGFVLLGLSCLLCFPYLFSPLHIFGLSRLWIRLLKKLEISQLLKFLFIFGLQCRPLSINVKASDLQT